MKSMNYAASAVVIGMWFLSCLRTWALTFIGGVASSNDGGRKKLSTTLGGYVSLKEGNPNTERGAGGVLLSCCLQRRYAAHIPHAGFIYFEPFLILGHILTSTTRHPRGHPATMAWCYGVREGVATDI
jgi:hypothetical protein